MGTRKGTNIFNIFQAVPESNCGFWLLSIESSEVIWPERDYCACVEAYDYHTTMHALFETSLHIGTFSSFAPKVAPVCAVRAARVQTLQFLCILVVNWFVGSGLVLQT